MRRALSNEVTLVALLLIGLACTGTIGDGAAPTPGDPGGRGNGRCAEIPDARAPFVRRSSNAELARTLRDVLGVSDLDLDEIVGAQRPPAGHFSNDARTVLKVETRQVEGYRDLAISVADRISMEALVDEHAPCRDFERACTEGFVASLGRDLYRRPLRPDEVTRLAALFDVVREEGDELGIGARLVLEAMLQSPHFLYRIEREPAPGTGPRALDSHELASRLSYFVWGTAPDDALSAAADSGALTEVGELESQVDRMLDDPRAGDVLLEIVRDWLRLDDLDAVSFDPAVYGEVDAELRAAIVEEVRVLFRTSWERDDPMMEMFTTREAFLSPALARLYGIEPSGSESSLYDLSRDPHRSGILTRAAVVGLQGQVSRAQTEPEPSVVHRGKFLLEHFFCGSIPPPPNEVRNDPSFGREFDTEREATEVRAANPLCAGCHASIDPMGLAMSTYDNLGRHRETDVHGFPVRSDGVFVHPVTAENTPFASLSELSDVLSSDPAVRSCIVQQLAQYAVGERARSASDGCIQRDVAERAGPGASFRDVLRTIALHPSFRHIGE